MVQKLPAGQVLQDQEFERVGSARTIRVNVRIVAATNRPLVQMVTERQFRGDLYYRVNVFPIELPALRERREDIPLLAYHFIRKCSLRMNKRIEAIPHEAMQALMDYDWPGNVRELENLIERALILSPGAELCVPCSELRQSPAQEQETSSMLNVMERECILRALSKSGWVIGGPKGAAAKLGVKRTTVQYKIKKHGIVRPSRTRMEC